MNFVGITGTIIKEIKLGRNKQTNLSEVWFWVLTRDEDQKVGTIELPCKLDHDVAKFLSNAVLGDRVEIEGSNLGKCTYVKEIKLLKQRKSEIVYMPKNEFLHTYNPKKVLENEENT